jgi:class 3 adenylate cyclase/tetratricopeptide (TPR) repeat protein
VARRERKVVTVVFCDLVGFTSQAETMDPEDVEAILRPYHERVRSELEHYGGTVEKFIGDAVMALFGAPVTHEDDPERAVRAALAIRDFAVEEGLELRVGITTGEALVSLDARPDAGEGMASGDVVNTAARLQSAAPVNGILVGEMTYRATRDAVEYSDAEPVTAKGKAEPVPVWEAVEARARFGTEVLDHEAGTLVGRERELDVLRSALTRVREERSPQLVTLVGVPGIGKSRLLYELSAIAHAERELITWRQGRCLAYGDGVTFWALAEIVKAQAGILEADDEETVAGKLRHSVQALVEPADVDWIEAMLRPLIGLAEAELGGDVVNQTFAAWRRFLEELAAQRPLILVFEDLQWADEGLLDFVDELVEWTTGVPLLVVCTARPELLTRRPGWGGGKLNSTTIALEPLTDEETAKLLAHVLERSVVPADVQQSLLDRAGGNPLYAEQFAQLYVERGSADELPLPETLQGIIGARLDALEPEEKDLLQSASVVGKVFWTGVLGNGLRDTDRVLHGLERKGFVRRQRRSSVAGESELAFAHALVRDVAYGQIPRAERAERHRAVAEWIVSLGRSDDHAEMLAHHWRSALELARAAGSDDSALEERARLALSEAGDRALALNAFRPAEGYYAEALALWPERDPDRPQLLFRRAYALYLAADDRREDVLAEARDALLEAGDRERAAETEVYLSRSAWYRGHRDDAEAHMERAQELVQDVGPSLAKARVLAFSARLRMLAGDLEQSERMGSEALAVADDLEHDELRIHSLTTIGGAKNRLHQMTGFADLERALEIALQVNSPLVATIYNNLAVARADAGEIRAAAELYREGLRAAEKIGDRDSVRFTRGNLLYTSLFLGEWDAVIADAERLLEEFETSPHYMEGAARMLRAYIRLARGDATGALTDLQLALEQGRAVRDPQRFLPALAQSARGYALLGREREAHELALEALEVARAHPNHATTLAQMMHVADQLELRTEMRDLIARAPGSAWKRPALLELEGESVAAADAFAEMGAATFEAESRLSAAKQLIAAGRREEGEAELERALAFYRSVGATFYIERGEALLASAQSESA